MRDTQKKLEISQEERALIEAALHTQSKILHMQASAGGAVARKRLNEVKRLLARMEQHEPAARRCRRFAGFGRLRMSRLFG